MRYRQGWKALSRLLHEDRSFSGYERNCAFLNVQGDGGGQRFADISAASGWDFADDSRALALSDWDMDGDLDIWVTNRTAPRIRLLRNNSASKNHFLAIQLRGDGSRTNRDAIGARVEVVLKKDNAEDGNARPLVKALSAGDGFLSQSSSWLHFGLGDSTEIRHVVVRWPGGETQQYDQIEVDGRYVIRQQSGQVEKWSVPANRKRLIAEHQNPPAPEAAARTVLPSRRLLPTLRPEGDAGPINATIKRPTVITIWSATCPMCIAELKEFTLQAARLREAGIDVIAINLDNLEGNAEAANRVLESMNFPFATVFGTVELVRSLDILKRAIFDRWQTLTVPASFLVDERGYVCVLYRGSVHVEQLLSDVRLLKVPAERLREFSTPFPGRWITPPTAADPLQVTSHFIDEAIVDNGIEYLERHAAILEHGADGKEPGDLYYVLAVLLREQEQIDASLAAYRKAIQYRPGDFRFRNDFAGLLAKTGQLDEAVSQWQEALRINPQHLDVHRKLGFLHMARRNPSEAIIHFAKVLEIRPNDIACSYNLANAYRSDGQLENAVEAYRHTLEMQPKMTLAANNLAWILATHPNAEIRNGAEAVLWAKRVSDQTNDSQAAFLDTLACAYAENGDFQYAIAAADRAIAMYNENGDDSKAANVEARLELFRRGQPFRDDLQ